MATTLQQRLSRGDFLIAPGVADTLGAVLAERAGFSAVFLSGSAMSYSSLGRPDIGLMSLEEVANITRRIAERCSLGIVVDADSGFGNAYNVYRTVRALELSGAAALQLEDQVHDKHPGGIGNRPLIALTDMLDKIKAALDARRNPTTLISARSDAAVSVSVDEALDRAQAYIECGADMLFLEGLPHAAARRQLVDTNAGAVPLVYNLGWQATVQPPSARELSDEGFSVALDPAVAITATVRGIAGALHELAQQHPDPPRSRGPEPETAAEAIDASAFVSLYQRWSTSDEH